MAIDSYDNLQAAIRTHFDASNNADLSSQIQTFIQLAEVRFNYGARGGPVQSEPFRVREMEAITDMTPSSGVCTLPDDYLEWRRVTAKTSPRRPLSQASADWMDWRYPYQEAGSPEHFYIRGNSLVILPTTTSDIELLYYQTIPALSDGNTSNWLLTKHPSIYLYGSLLEAAIFAQPERVSEFATLFASSAGGLIRSDKSARWAASVARVRGPTP